MTTYNYVEKRNGVRTEVIFDGEGTIEGLLVETVELGYRMSALRQDTYERIARWEIESTDRVGLVPGDELLKYMPEYLEHPEGEANLRSVPLRAIVTDVLGTSQEWIAALGMYNWTP